MFTYILIVAVAGIIAVSNGATFYTGADMSALPTYDCYGTCSPYKSNKTAASEDALSILAKAGINAIRLRIWNDPDKSGEYCNLDGVLKMAKRVYENGLKLHLDFHYSDTWADPHHQIKPQAWANLTISQLKDAVYKYTTTVMHQLYIQNTPPTSVQIGNEIDNGMLWPEKGQACEDSGSLSCPNNWKNLASLLSAGLKGVADVAHSFWAEIPLRMIHVAKMNGGTVNDVEDWFRNYENNGGASFEIIGLSFYGAWGAKLESISSLKKLSQTFPGKQWILVETSHPYYNVTGWNSPYPFTPQGQVQFASAITEAVKQNGGLGVYWWGTEYYNKHPSQWSSLWDSTAVALPAMQAF